MKPIIPLNLFTGTGQYVQAHNSGAAFPVSYQSGTAGTKSIQIQVKAGDVFQISKVEGTQRFNIATYRQLVVNELCVDLYGASSPNNPNISTTFTSTIDGYMNIYVSNSNETPTLFIYKVGQLKQVYVPPAVVTLTSDYVGKVSFSTVENPNMAKGTISTALQPPSGFTNESSQNLYDYLKVLDGLTRTSTGSASGQISQHLFSFDVISIIERQLGVGVWQGKTLLSDKIQIAKQLVTNISADWYGYGGGPSGNSCRFTLWQVGGAYHTGGNHSSGTVQKITHNMPLSFDKYIDSNGFVHYLAYTEASNGTISSVINTDYISFSLTVSVPYGGAQKPAITNPKKNYFKKTLLEIGTMAFSVGNSFEGMKAASTSRARFSTLIDIRPNTNYIMTVPTGYNMAIQTYTSTGISIADSSWQNNGYIKTTENNAFNACILVRRTDNAVLTLQEILGLQFQLEEGSAITSYEDYQPLNRAAQLLPSSFSFISDYKGKVLGSTVENPNIVRRGSSSALQTPTGSLVEGIQATYDNLKTLDGSISTNSSTTNGNMYQYLLAFDILSILERQLGVSIWNGKTLLSDKLNIAKSIVTNVRTDWYGYGSSPTGNKATVKWWSSGLNQWSTSKVATHTNNTPAQLSILDNAGLGYVDSNGFMYVLAYAEVSDGVTASIINTDYISLTLTGIIPNGGGLKVAL